MREIEAKPDIADIKAAEREERRKEREARADEPIAVKEPIDEEEEEEALLSPDDSILILTGANASGGRRADRCIRNYADAQILTGKSVFLKTVALIVYMAGHVSS